MELRNGFYTALGTPLDDSGRIIVKSLRKEIDQQIEAGASGLLLMGTMGMLGCVPDWTYEEAVAAAVDQVAGRVPLLVGAADNSFARVKGKLDILNRFPVNATFTAPYYLTMNAAKLPDFFEACANYFKGNVFLYDHLPITKHKITFPMMQRLVKTKNIVGIKSADLDLIKRLIDADYEGFTPIFSGSDLFVPAYKFGATHYLDGVFACMPKSTGAAQKLLDAGDFDAANLAFNRIMHFRDELLACDLWPAFSYAMNLIGCEGNFAPDFEGVIAESNKARIEAGLRELGEI